MNDILEFIDELKELQALYHSGELRDFDFNTKIQKYERDVARFEAEMIAQNELFFREPVVQYNPVYEV
jgi:hypothetical protein